METYSVEILNPKAKRLLEDLADLELITLQLKTPPALKPTLTEKELAAAQERIMQGGSQTLNVDEMVAYVKEARERKLPFRDDE